jgi:hypothetical protein
MNLFQGKLQRCIQVCQDEAQDSLPIDKRNDPIALKASEGKLYKCAKICVDKQISMLPSLEAKILSDISRG